MLKVCMPFTSMIGLCGRELTKGKQQLDIEVICRGVKTSELSCAIVHFLKRVEQLFVVVNRF